MFFSKANLQLAKVKAKVEINALKNILIENKNCEEKNLIIEQFDKSINESDPDLLNNLLKKEFEILGEENIYICLKKFINQFENVNIDFSKLTIKEGVSEICKYKKEILQQIRESDLYEK